MKTLSVSQIQSTLHKDSGLVGRDTEVENLVHCVRGGKHVLLEGPVGVGKTALQVANMPRFADYPEPQSIHTAARSVWCGRRKEVQL